MLPCSARSSSGRTESRASTCTRQSPGTPLPFFCLTSGPSSRRGPTACWLSQAHAPASTCICTPTPASPAPPAACPACAGHTDGRLCSTAAAAPAHGASHDQLSCHRRLLANLYSGHVYIWNYNDQTVVKSFEVTELPGPPAAPAYNALFPPCHLQTANSTAKAPSTHRLGCG